MNVEKTTESAGTIRSRHVFCVVHSNHVVNKKNIRTTKSNHIRTTRTNEKKKKDQSYKYRYLIVGISFQAGMKAALFDDKISWLKSMYIELRRLHWKYSVEFNQFKRPQDLH